MGLKLLNIKYIGDDYKMERYRDGKIYRGLPPKTRFAHYKPMSKKPKFNSLTDLIDDKTNIPFFTDILNRDEYDNSKESEYIGNITKWQENRLQSSGWYIHGIEDDNGTVTTFHTHGLSDTLSPIDSTIYTHPFNHYEFRINWVDDENFNLAANLISLLANQVKEGKRFFHNNYFKYRKETYLLRIGKDCITHGSNSVLDIISLGKRSDGEVRNIITLLQSESRFLENIEARRVDLFDRKVLDRGYQE